MGSERADVQMQEVCVEKKAEDYDGGYLATGESEVTECPECKSTNSEFLHSTYCGEKLRCDDCGHVYVGEKIDEQLPVSNGSGSVK